MQLKGRGYYFLCGLFFLLFILMTKVTSRAFLGHPVTEPLLGKVIKKLYSSRQQVLELYVFLKLFWGSFIVNLLYN